MLQVLKFSFPVGRFQSNVALVKIINDGEGVNKCIRSTRLELDRKRLLLILGLSERRCYRPYIHDRGMTVKHAIERRKREETLSDVQRETSFATLKLAHPLQEWIEGMLLFMPSAEPLISYKRPSSKHPQVRHLRLNHLTFNTITVYPCCCFSLIN